MRLHNHAPQYPCTQFCVDVSEPEALCNDIHEESGAHRRADNS